MGISVQGDPGTDRTSLTAAVSTLRAGIRGEISDEPRRLAEYSSDASNYRVLPSAVLFPAVPDDVHLAVQVARDFGLPLTPRGAGTSVAGNAIGSGIVLDFSRHLDRIIEIDAERRTATVQPGVVLSSLQRAAAPSGLRFGPDPSTGSRCTLGGMIGNNACGPRAVTWGRTADNVRELEIVDGHGRQLLLGNGYGAVPGLEELVSGNLALLRTEFGRFSRQVSGYSLEHLLPENGRGLARALVGSEGTCGITVSATLDLVEIPPYTALAVLGYPDMPSAADDVVALLPLRPLAVEGLDSHLVDVVRAARGADRVPDLPAGGGWLFVETAGATAAEARAAAELICATAGTGAVRVIPTGPETAALWRIREDGAGLAGRTADGRPAWPGWEDAAVPPAVLGGYLRAFEELKHEHGVSGISYGHFGDGCVHTRLDLPIHDAPQRFHAFLADAARLVGEFGGSLSGEHGDGRARSEFLPSMYSPDALRAFADFKHLFDPDDLLNPGLITGSPEVAAAAADLRLAGVEPLPGRGFALSTDFGDLASAAHRCVGVGRCRADNGDSGGFMCPSYLATKDEKDSTRGRARVLQEAVRGALPGGLRSPELADSLDLCLSCKACASDCPAEVDMATYKSEVLHQRYRRRLRPRSHYLLGRLPSWLRLVTALPGGPGLTNRLGSWTYLRRPALRAAGLDPRRDLPALAAVPFRRWWKHRPTTVAPAPKGEVLLWADCFSNAFDADIPRQAVRVLEEAGYRVVVAEPGTCCAITLITTGQLDAARRTLRSTVALLVPHIRAGRAVVGLEPSCTAVLRSDLTELLPHDPGAAEVAAHTRTLAEFLVAELETGWRPRDLTGTTILAQPHCHQHASMGYQADLTLLASAGARVSTLAGCCGMAGNFGMEKGHYEISVAIADRVLVPAVESAAADTVLLADGFSCRTQARQLTDASPQHLAQVLSDPSHATGGTPSKRPPTHS